ncbi:vanadium-dependent haloperoxidase [Pedobacter sp. UYEF25]
MIVLLIAIFSSCNQERNKWKKASENPEYIRKAIKEITDVMVHDIYSPPVASRTYAYISTAAYEAAINGDEKKKYISLANQLHGLVMVPKPDKNKTYCFNLAAVHAVLMVGKKMVTSEDKVTKFYNDLSNEFKENGMPSDVYENSIAFGQEIADAILAWAATDNYIKTKSMSQYNVTVSEGFWQPTPPAYMKAVEPNWNKMRTLLIDSAAQFKPIPPPKFSKNPTSEFYSDAIEVKNALDSSKNERTDVAKFWDCNPFKVTTHGHIMYASKKISPGGHWINIAALTTKKVKADYIQTAETYAYVAAILYDSFISCWDEKFRSNTIRPETYINQYIDKKWAPLLQTPPFPEYTSGHSVASTAAAVALTKMYGDNFAFADSTEVEFGLPVRNFKSFLDASSEAAISRFYGGIHYMPAIRNGVEQGRVLANFCVDKFSTRRNKSYKN